MKKDDLIREGMDIALRLLKFRGRSEKDLEEQLRKKGVHREDAAAVVARLKELKLLDDEALARLWTDGARAGGMGDERIKQDLWKRGIPRDIIALVVVPPKEKGAPTESQRAREELTRRVKRLVTSGLDPKALTRRLGGMLARQGYSEEVVQDTLEFFFKGLRSEDE